MSRRSSSASFALARFVLDAASESVFTDGTGIGGGGGVMPAPALAPVGPDTPAARASGRLSGASSARGSGGSGTRALTPLPIESPYQTHNVFYPKNPRPRRPAGTAP